MTEPIVIVGGGIAGLALAAALRRHGRSTLVLEAHEHLSPGGAAISLWPNALAALDDIGLGARVRAAGSAASSGGIRRADGRWLRRVDRHRAEAALGEPVVAIQRADLLALLYSAVDPADIRFGAPVERITPSTRRVTVTMADGSALTACAVVGADGAGSVVARDLGERAERRYAGYTAWRGTTDLGIGETEPSQTWGPGGEFGFLPLGANRAYWFATRITEEGGHAPEGELAFLADAFAGWHAPIGDLIDATAGENVLRHDIYDRRPAIGPRSTPVALVGDAAHPMRPHLGQGGCQALVDAAVLARFVEGNSTLHHAFGRFAEHRRRDINRVVRASALLGLAIHDTGPLGRGLIALTPNAVVLPYTARIAGRRAFRLP